MNILPVFLSKQRHLVYALKEDYRAKNIRNLSAWPETANVEPLKFGEALSEEVDGNPEPSPLALGKRKGVET